MKLIRTALTLILFVVLAFFISGCNWTLLGCDLFTPTYDQDDFESMRQQCFDKINEYRSTIGVPPLTRYTQGDACADNEARLDSQSGIPHGAFGTCGIYAQNECPEYSSLGSICNTCLQQMWDEGPGEPYSAHGHYINMANTTYTKISIGFYQDSSHKVWAIFNFYY